VHRQTHSITASECISKFSRLSFSDVSQIALKHHLQPVQIYHVSRGCYINTEIRIQPEYMTCKNRWTISSTYDFPAHQQCSQRKCFSQSALQWFEVLPGLWPALPDAPRLVVGATRLDMSASRHVVGALTYHRCSQMHLKFSPVHRGVLKPVTITTMLLQYQ